MLALVAGSYLTYANFQQLLRQPASQLTACCFCNQDSPLRTACIPAFAHILTARLSFHPGIFPSSADECNLGICRGYHHLNSRAGGGGTCRPLSFNTCCRMKRHSKYNSALASQVAAFIRVAVSEDTIFVFVTLDGGATRQSVSAQTKTFLRLLLTKPGRRSESWLLGRG